MQTAKPLAKVLLRAIVLLTVLYVGFRYLGDFSPQQSSALSVMTWLLYGLYENLKAKFEVSQAVQNVFSPFRVSIYPNWYELLSDFKLIRSKEEWNRLDETAEAQSKTSDYVFYRKGFSFTVLKPMTENSQPPGLMYSDNLKFFLNEADLSESIMPIDDDLGRYGQAHPLFNHPKWSQLPEVYFKWGVGGYEIGLEVHDDWWKDLSKDGEVGELSKLTQHRDSRCGTTRLLIASLPYSEFSIYYQDVPYEQMQKHQDARDKLLEEKGWKRQHDDPDAEIRDSWSRVEHKYFAVAHRTI
jgi:hypothetical protein